mgnify:CR=1 FL=1
MTDPNRPNDDPAQAGEPVVSKPYVMPDDPEPGSVEMLQKEVADARDRTLRTLAEMENLRRRTQREVEEARKFAVTGFAQSAHSGESGMISLLMLTNSLTGVRSAPLEAWFQHKRPADLRPYQELFPCPLHFEKPYRRLLLPRETMELKFVRADRALQRYLSHHADALLQRLRPDRSVAEQVRGHLTQALASGEPQERLVARQLEMSPRTLQRHLRTEGVTFGKLLDEVRHELARSYLRDKSIGITDIAFLLGYAEPSTFFRAFRRWTGTTPHKARMQAYAMRVKGLHAPPDEQ